MCNRPHEGAPSSGLMPICTLEPPHSTPISRIMATAASRSRWYSLSVSVCQGSSDGSTMRSIALQAPAKVRL